MKQNAYLREIGIINSSSQRKPKYLWPFIIRD